MSLKFPLLLLSFLCGSCLDDDDPEKIERWYVDSWKASTSISCPSDPLPESNHVIEMLLGFHDARMTETEVLFHDNGEMEIRKNDRTRLVGRWTNSTSNTLTLGADGESWNFEVIDNNNDSVVLRAEYYRNIRQVDIVLKPR
jgi:hypothetical protein